MKVPIEMSRERYDLFVAELEIKSPAYTILMNNIVPQGQQTARARQTIEILCDKEEAELLLDAATGSIPPPFRSSQKPLLARASRRSVTPPA